MYMLQIKQHSTIDLVLVRCLNDKGYGTSYPHRDNKANVYIELFALQQWHQLNLLVDFWCISKLSVWGVFRDLDHGYSSRQCRAYYWQRQKFTIAQVTVICFFFGGGGTCYCPICPVTAPKFSQGLRLPSVMHIRWVVVILTRHSNWTAILSQTDPENINGKKVRQSEEKERTHREAQEPTTVQWSHSE